jgi:hypothetical protein
MDKFEGSLKEILLLCTLYDKKKAAVFLEIKTNAK